MNMMGPLVPARDTLAGRNARAIVPQYSEHYQTLDINDVESKALRSGQPTGPGVGRRGVNRYARNAATDITRDSSIDPKQRAIFKQRAKIIRDLENTKSDLSALEAKRKQRVDKGKNVSSLDAAISEKTLDRKYAEHQLQQNHLQLNNPTLIAKEREIRGNTEKYMGEVTDARVSKQENKKGFGEKASAVGKGTKEFLKTNFQRDHKVAQDTIYNANDKKRGRLDDDGNKIQYAETVQKRKFLGVIGPKGDREKTVSFGRFTPDFGTARAKSEEAPEQRDHSLGTQVARNINGHADAKRGVKRAVIIAPTELGKSTAAVIETVAIGGSPTAMAMAAQMNGAFHLPAPPTAGLEAGAAAGKLGSTALLLATAGLKEAAHGVKDGVEVAQTGRALKKLKKSIDSEDALHEINAGQKRIEKADDGIAKGTNRRLAYEAELQHLQDHSAVSSNYIDASEEKAVRNEEANLRTNRQVGGAQRHLEKKIHSSVTDVLRGQRKTATRYDLNRSRGRMDLERASETDLYKDGDRWDQWTKDAGASLAHEKLYGKGVDGADNHSVGELILSHGLHQTDDALSKLDTLRDEHKITVDQHAAIHSYFMERQATKSAWNRLTGAHRKVKEEAFGTVGMTRLKAAQRVTRNAFHNTAASTGHIALDTAKYTPKLVAETTSEVVLNVYRLLGRTPAKVMQRTFAPRLPQEQLDIRSQSKAREAAQAAVGQMGKLEDAKIKKLVRSGDLDAEIKAARQEAKEGVSLFNVVGRVKARSIGKKNAIEDSVRTDISVESKTNNAFDAALMAKGGDGFLEQRSKDIYSRFRSDAAFSEGVSRLLGVRADKIYNSDELAYLSSTYLKTMHKQGDDASTSAIIDSARTLGLHHGGDEAEGHLATYGYIHGFDMDATAVKR